MKLNTDRYSRMFPWTDTNEEKEIFLGNPYKITIGSSHDIRRNPKFCWCFNLERVGGNEIQFFCDKPLDQMPLYINDSLIWKKLFSWYRLTVGR